jgi:tetratricopeptide (TPR) repeat protein
VVGTRGFVTRGRSEQVMNRVYQFSIRDKNAERIRSALDLLDGVIQSMRVDGKEIQVTWQANTDPLEQVADLLQNGNYADGILLLELFQSADPDNSNILFNLGMAYSDRGELTRSIELLQKLIEKEPHHTNGRVALGVALLRARKTEEGIKELQTAISQQPDNLWARRNLGAGLMQAERFNEAIEHLRRATELAPTDQAAWYGLAQALQFSGDTTEADKAYIKVIGMDEFSEIAELARNARSKIAEKAFHNATDSPRMDAVMYCLSALQQFEKLPIEQVRNIGMEIAFLGTRGIDVNNPNSRYTIKSLPGEFSGLHLLSLQYVAFKKIAPDQNIGFDLSAEYQTALKLFRKQGE